MSLLINWENLDNEIASNLLEWLNNRFSQISRPSFIGLITITSLDFGSVPPEIELHDLSDPLPEFYLTPECEVTSSESESDSASSISDKNELTLLKSDDEAAINSDEFEDSFDNTIGRPLMVSGNAYLMSPGINGMLASRFTASQRSSNWVHQQMMIHQKLASGIKVPVVDEVSFNSGSQSSAVEEPGDVELEKDDSRLKGQVPTWLGRREYDCQLEVAMRYNGNMRLTIETELLVNQPTPAFLVLPITLSLTGLTFSAEAIIAYLGDRVNFCFKPDQSGESLLKDVSLESEIGDSGKQVLKNVAKIEKFIVDQLRDVVDDY
ncbi:Mitochondrial distribution and morphology protein 12, partial [Nowakowskiella sp. JEL0078]